MEGRSGAPDQGKQRTPACPAGVSIRFVYCLDLCGGLPAKLAVRLHKLRMIVADRETDLHE